VPDDTPPPGPTPIPSIGTISRQLQGVAGQLHGARNDLDALTERVRLVQQDSAELRKLLKDPPALPSAAGGSSLSPAPTPSMAVQAAQKAGSLGKYTLIVIGALGVASQVAALFKPGLVGPIQVLIDLLQQLGGHP